MSIVPAGFELSESGRFAYIKRLFPLPQARRYRDERLAELAPHGRLIVVRMGKTLGGIAIAFDAEGLAEAQALGRRNRKRCNDRVADAFIDLLIGRRMDAGRRGAV